MRPVVVPADHIGSASDPRDRGPLDLARVSSRRRGDILATTIVARRPWRDSLIRSGRVKLSLLYDVNEDGKPDRRDVVRWFKGHLTSWISTSDNQGIQAARLARSSPTTVSIDRPAEVFFSAAGQAPLLGTEPIGVAAVARWKGGSDRVPDRGWIVVPAP
jgi:hypothetical protein